MTLLLRMAAFVQSLTAETLPAEVVERAKACLLNGLGMALGSRDTPYHGVARDAALASFGSAPDGATVLGDGRKTGLAGAIMANVALFHGRTQDDAIGAAHFGAMIIPTLLALIEQGGLSTERLTPALVAGYEIGGLLEAAGSSRSSRAGFRASPLYGPVAVAAAVAKLLDLSTDRTAAALAHAAAFSGGTLQAIAEGADEWRYQLGVAAVNGLIAARLAAAGSAFAKGALDGPVGLLKSFTGVDHDANALAAQLGREWAILRVMFKPFPVCAFNQSPVMAALSIKEKHRDLRAVSVRLRMNPDELSYAGMTAKGPFASISATLMSTPFCIATTLIHGAPTIALMTSFADGEVNELARRIELTPDRLIPPLGCDLTVACADGASLTARFRPLAKDFGLDLCATERLVRGVGAESGVHPQAYDQLVSFVNALPRGDIRQAIRAFARTPEGAAP